MLALSSPNGRPHKKKTQVDEYLEYNDETGPQHIALNTTNCIATVENLKARGV